jgi:hypothetical protein
MADDLGTGELSSPATNGATGNSVSALSVRAKSTTIPLLILIAGSTLIWAAVMAIHGF